MNIRGAILVLALPLAIIGVSTLVGCTNPTSSSGNSNGAQLSGTVTFSPLTDSLSKFAYPANSSPSLEILNEATTGTGTAYMVVQPNGKTSGRLDWQFCVPAGKNPSRA